MELTIGKTMYHFNPKRNAISLATIVDVEDRCVRISLEQPVAGSKREFMILKSQIGKHLFYTKQDVCAPAEELVEKEEYLRHGNNFLNEVYQHKSDETAHHLARRKLLDKLCNEYNFQGFHHYTDFNNFIMIKEQGELLSRVRAEQRGIPQESGHWGILKKTEDEIKKHVRFFYRPNPPMLYNNEGIKKCNTGVHMPIPVLLVFDENIIFHDVKSMIFINGCGGAQATTKTRCAKEAYHFRWEQIFSSQYLQGPEKDARNAEFLYYNMISLKYLKNVFFRSKVDLQRAVHLFGQDPVFKVNPDYFTRSNRRGFVEANYLESFDVKLIGSIVLITGNFKWDPSGYDCSLVAEFINGKRQAFELEVSYKNGKYSFVAPLIKKPAKIELFLNGHLSGYWEG